MRPVGPGLWQHPRCRQRPEAARARRQAPGAGHAGAELQGGPLFWRKGIVGELIYSGFIIISMAIFNSYGTFEAFCFLGTDVFFNQFCCFVNKRCKNVFVSCSKACMVTCVQCFAFNGFLRHCCCFEDWLKYV